MRVLYLWNTAGVFTPVADWLINNGHEAKIVARYEFDIYKHTQHSQASVMVDSASDFFKKGVSLIRKWKPDIIHVSGSIKMLIFARAAAPRGTIVFTYHGSDARNPSGKPHPEVTLADFVHVTTPDLKPYGTWIDRPLDPEFRYHGSRVANTALLFYSPHFYVDSREKAKAWCENRGITLFILDRSLPDWIPIPNHMMPRYLSKFEYYLDFKDQKGELHALSKIALEALACGCKVVHDSDLDHVITQGDVTITRPSQYYQLYVSLMPSPPQTGKAIKRIPRLLLSLLKFMSGRVKRYGGKAL